MKAAGPESNSDRRSITATRSSMLVSPLTSTQRPKRSRSWGRKSPSSGFIVPKMAKVRG